MANCIRDLTLEEILMLTTDARKLAIRAAVRNNIKNYKKDILTNCELDTFNKWWRGHRPQNEEERKAEIKHLEKMFYCIEDFFSETQPETTDDVGCVEPWKGYGSRALVLPLGERLAENMCIS
jgi:hypothetical protein